MLQGIYVLKICCCFLLEGKRPSKTSALFVNVVFQFQFGVCCLCSDFMYIHTCMYTVYTYICTQCMYMYTRRRHSVRERMVAVNSLQTTLQLIPSNLGNGQLIEFNENYFMNCRLIHNDFILYCLKFYLKIFLFFLGQIF